MQNVLIVHNHYRIPGGEDTVAKNEAELLIKHGHRVIRYERDNGEDRSTQRKNRCGACT